MFLKRLKVLFLVIICIHWVFCVPTAYASQNVEEESESVKTALVLADANTSKILSSANGKERMKAGTLTKIMTALLVAESIDKGELTLDTLVTASNNAQSASGAVVWLTAGEKMTVGDLILSMMTGNANDASIALAEKLCISEERFVEKMNDKAKTLGMNDTFYTNCTGLDDENSYSTAEDIALLCCELTRFEFMYQYMTPWLTYIRGGETELVNFNDLVKSVEGIIGIKASKTESSQFCLAAAAKRDGECYVAVCLNFEEKETCMSAGKSLLKSGFSSYTTVYPIIDATLLHNIAVKNGVKKSVGVDVQISPICVPCSDEELISSAVFLPSFVSAPVKKGQKFGTLAIYADDVLVAELDICAQSDVEKENITSAFLSLLETLLK